VDVKSPTDERLLLRTAKSCGPGAPRSGAKLATMLAHCADDGGKRDGSPGRARISRKPLRREGRLSPPVPVVHALRANLFCARAPGAAATRSSLRPLFLRGRMRCKARANSVARMRIHVSPAVMPRAGGASSTRQRLGSSCGVSGILDRPPSRTMTAERVAV
jgi:hypothetical protein